MTDGAWRPARIEKPENATHQAWNVCVGRWPQPITTAWLEMAMATSYSCARKYLRMLKAWGCVRAEGGRGPGVRFVIVERGPAPPPDGRGRHDAPRPGRPRRNPRAARQKTRPPKNFRPRRLKAD